MGEEITSSEFDEADLEQFGQQLQEETQVLERYFREGGFSNHTWKAGYELEAWLLDPHNRVAPDNEHFLARLGSPSVVPELARFNFEINGEPRDLGGDTLNLLHEDLEATWSRCREVASDRGEYIVMIGTLPCIRKDDFCLANMSPLSRYRALNRRVFDLRGQRPLHLHIEGAGVLDTWKHDVMLEAATTSFQIHLQVPLDRSVAAYNAALLCSAPMVAIAANSPFLFGKRLWDETRIPVFEQSVDLGEKDFRRVGFGSGYLRESLLECFEENLHHFPPLIPLDNDAPPERLTHLRFHNGTIWRWNRPLVDFNAAGKPHIRIEHRVVAAGPTPVDCIANAAFFFGLVRGLTDTGQDPASLLPFATTRGNFYLCARHGLDAKIVWRNGTEVPVKELILDELLPLASAGLAALGTGSSETAHWLGLIRDRASSGQNGARWQTRWVETHGMNLNGLVSRYRELQDSGAPVHTWPTENT